MVNRRALVGVVLALVVAAVVTWWGPYSRESPRSSSAPAAVAPSSSDESHVAAKSVVIALPSAPKATIPSPSAPLRAARTSALQEYERAGRLPDLVRQLLQRAGQGDAESAYVVFLVSEECRFITYKNPPNWLAGDSSDPKVRARRDSYEHRLSRCDGLQDFAELWRKPEQFRDIAAEGGYFPAKAATLTPLLLAGRDDEASTAAVSVINAVDGNSVMGLYSYVTRRNNGPVIGDPPHAVDRPAYDAAWIMSACELGLSCGSGSQLLETICISTGRCGFNSYDEFARQFLNDQQYQQAGQLRGQIVSALRSGGVTFFGLRPRGG